VDGECGPTSIADKASSKGDPKDPGQNQIYTIRIKGHLDEDWSEWLDHLTIKHKEDGTTVLTGPVGDAPAMYGLLIKLRDLGLSLISVNQCEPHGTYLHAKPQRRKND
jgi:hypothetical protein